MTSILLFILIIVLIIGFMSISIKLSNILETILDVHGVKPYNDNDDTAHVDNYGVNRSKISK